MSYVITVDSGTTNTRISLWKENDILSTVSYEVGVRNTAIDGNNERLKSTVRKGISEVLATNKLLLHDVSQIFASGMITSNVGLVEIPHLVAPVGLKDFVRGIQTRYLPDVVDKEIGFIPGVKNPIQEITLDNCEAMDIMRGEEVETIGLIERLGIKGPAVVVLPGSHTKYVSINDNNEITGCLTSLAGELISVITQNTILASSLGKSFATEYSEEYVLKGFELSKRSGLNRTCFTVRILDQFTNLSKNEKANFLLGAVMAEDVKALRNSQALTTYPNSQVIIAGKEILSKALAAVIKKDGFFQHVSMVESDLSRNLAGFGAICIAKQL